MALIVYCSTPTALRSLFESAIIDKDIKTWEFFSDDVHFTHTSDQWSKRAWFKCATFDNRLVFKIVPPKGRKISDEVYAEYHGLLLRAFLYHFDTQFLGAFATAMPDHGDSVS